MIEDNNIPEETISPDLEDYEISLTGEKVPPKVVAEADETHDAEDYPDWEAVDYFVNIPDESEVVVQLPSADENEIKEHIRNAPDLTISDNEETKAWLGSIVAGSKTLVPDDVFKASIKDGTWRKGIEFEGDIVGATNEDLPEVRDTRITGDEALTRLTLFSGEGQYHSIPLWSSGIWLTLAPIPEEDLLTLFRDIHKSKIALGNYTYGAIFSGTGGYQIEIIANFIVNHLASTTLKYETKEDILKSISINDFQDMLAHLNAAIYVDGLNYETACTKNPSKCRHIAKRKLDIRSLIRNRSERVPNDLRKFMRDSKAHRNRVTPEVSKSYRSSLDNPINRVITVDLGDGKVVKLRLKVPTISETIESTHRWMDSINELVNRSVAKPKDDKARERYMQDQALASALRQYAHYVEDISFGDSVAIYGVETIERALVRLTRSDDAREAIVSGIHKFIDESAITVVGIPEFQCPACTPESEKAKGVNIIPLNQLEVFYESAWGQGKRDSDTGKSIADSDFGTGDEYERFMSAISKVEVVPDETRTTFLNQLYETIFGIKDHDGGKDPYSPYLYNDKNITPMPARYDRLLDDYLGCEINNLFGISLIEFLRLSPEVSKHMCNTIYALKAKSSEVPPPDE